MLTQLEKAGIKIIRMGLQPTPELQRPGEIIAGPFHPGFGELVQSELFKWQAILLINRFMEREVTNRLKVYVNKRDLSKMIGQKRRNLQALEARFQLDQLEVMGTEGSEQAWVGWTGIGRFPNSFYRGKISCDLSDKDHVLNTA